MHIKVTPGLRRHHNKKGKPHWKIGKKVQKKYLMVFGYGYYLLMENRKVLMNKA